MSTQELKDNFYISFNAFQNEVYISYLSNGEILFESNFEV